MGMKVCKLVRLTQKDTKGNYINGKEGNITVRERAIVSEESIAETESNYKSSGLLYVVDEKATAKREKELEVEAKQLEEAKTPPAPPAPSL